MKSALQVEQKEVSRFNGEVGLSDASSRGFGTEEGDIPAHQVLPVPSGAFLSCTEMFRLFLEGGSVKLSV